MPDPSTNGHKDTREATTATTPPQEQRRRRTPWPLMVVAGLLVVVPFAYWYGTWFGRGLSDEQMEKYLNEGDANPRHVQHALSQVGERIEKGRPDAERWLPRVVEAVGSRSADVRMTAAWVMGMEHRREDFRDALLRLVEDPEPIVRRNAALALVRFGDPRCRPVLLSMLKPHTVTAGTEGTALTALTAGTPVRRDTLLLRYTVKPNVEEEVRSPLPGKISDALVKEGDNFTAGSDLFRIAPDAEQVRDALIGLAYFGELEDLPEIERYAAGVEGMSEEVKKQAARTAEAVRRRPSQKT
jgi:hypothetical protein